MIARRLIDGQASFINERRAVSVIFATFPGPDCDEDPQAGRKLQRYFGQLFAIVRRYDGYINKVAMGERGGTALILFGAPLAHEDDADRALHCALEIRSVPPPAGPADATQIGVAGGLVFSGEVGSATRREYTVIGDTVNVAARLMQQAGPGQILASAAARRAAGPCFDWDEPYEIQLRGRAASIGVAALAGARSGGEASAAPAAALVGRASELAYLRGRLDMAAAGRGALVGLAGAAGLGKSALAATLLAAAAERGALGLRGECVSYRASSSYLAWQRPLRRLFGLAADWSAERAARQLERQLAAIDPRLAARTPLLGPALGLPLADTKLTAGLDAELRKSALEHLLLTCIAHFAARRPLLIVLESCDWIDPLSRELLEALARQADRLPLLVLLTYRGGVGADADGRPRPPRLANFGELPLAELPPADAVALIEQTVRRLFGPQAAMPPALAQRIIARAGGNPFYIEEILSLVQSRGANLNDAEAVAGVELPDSLSSLILSRIDQLAESAQTALKVASVIGQEFTPGWIAGVHPPLGSGAALDLPLAELRQRDLAVLDRAGPDPRYLFRHMITREAAYNSLSRATRAGLHERAGAYIEQLYAGNLDRQLDLLVYHYGLSDNQRKQREYLARAAAAAQAACASEAAIGFYRRLLPLLRRRERSEVLQQIGRALCHIGRWDEAEASYSQALAQAPSPASEATCRRLIGELRLRRGDFAGARAWLEQSRTICAAAGDRDGESAALHQLGMVAWSQGDSRAALGQLERSLDLGAGADRARTAQTLNNIGLVYLACGDQARALDCFDRCLRLAAGAGNRQQIGVAIGNMGNVYLARGDYARALECYGQKLQYALDLGDRWEIGISVGNLGHIYEAQGEYGRAELCYLRSLTIALELGDQLGVGAALLGLAALAAARSAPADAEALFGRAEALLRAIEAAYELCECRYGQAELAARRGDQRQALVLLAEALALAGASSHHEVAQKCQILAVEAERALGRIGAARAVGALLGQLASLADDEARAAVHYALVRIDAARADDRTAAARLYRALHAHTPNAEYRRRYAELMGVALPPPPPLPPLPAVVGERPADLKQLLDQVDQLIAQRAPPSRAMLQ
jgi:class 3 adenylate cyclase/tetratricopeptide (TPR) repeat protein